MNRFLRAVFISLVGATLAQALSFPTVGSGHIPIGNTIAGPLTVNSSVTASSFIVSGSTVPNVATIAKAKTTVDTVAYTSSTANGYPVTGLSFPLAANTSYYYEIHGLWTSTATSSSIWPGVSFPVSSTNVWSGSSPRLVGGALDFYMNNGKVFSENGGSAVPVIGNTYPLFISGKIFTVGAGTLQIVMRTQLETGKVTILAGSSGFMWEE